MDSPRVFRVSAGCRVWIIVAMCGVEALETAQVLHQEAEEQEFAGTEYRGFPYSFEVESLGSVDAATPAALEPLLAEHEDA